MMGIDFLCKVNEMNYLIVDARQLIFNYCLEND